DPEAVHKEMAEALDRVLDRIRSIQQEARNNGTPGRPVWPMLVLRTPKGWTGPEEVDGEPIEGTWRSHQVPLSGLKDNPAHLRQLEAWLRSYEPEKLFTKEGSLAPELQELAPKGLRRMGANPHANGGVLLKDLRL